MNFLDFIVTGCFGSPSLPPLPEEPEKLPDVNQSDEDKKVRMASLQQKKKGRGSLITNKGGAAGLEGETDEAKKTKLGGFG